MTYSIEVLLEEKDEFSTFLKNRIQEYNNEHSLPHRNTRAEGSIKPINIIVSDSQQKWIGGITAECYWNWVEIHYFWFSEESRGKGLGGQLLDQVETIARQNGATKALLTTYEFQARSFYELKGYEVVGEIKDYPPGSSYYTMVKTLIDNPPSL
ncbi:GCN5 family acetyltransferase [Aneurinibacillus migulanus]|uniref:Acetyltransferase (GNAT) family protein n=1 Tax=Aneurinibacillus migulanus TaxID=47500 RepID=A0A0D1WIA6_ANEMI|nr:GNAT family N-acetyltransferase [Aneurinibacillus migulanus]KIV55931.1 GCN5 family acetyltransferase [Aneurinibacillus migulanus]KIV58310.1 GCN5 family acetyltransferase [Aneurinibacillus migulanus]KON95960.1 GCN5 family acetyltransferase [Aneurinibacillus migulanus]KPD09966.1 GCN5 family acetyltransferase [Aneurinibacillus migulanus]MED0893469.1 GNAT family N-acetyltransferase [Aneurinibacillus migulanus]